MELFTGYTFFSALVLLSIPAIILGIKEKNIKYYGFFVTLVFVFLALMKSPKAIMYLVIFCLFEYFIIREYLRIYKAKGRNAKTYYIFVFLSLLPLMLNKFLPVLPGHLKIFAFLGISYMTFKGTQIIIEIYDGLIEDVKLFDFAYLFLFFPTITSGPIDRSRRFEEDLKRRISKEEYLDNLGTAIFRILLGAMYKTVFAALFYQAMLRLERTSDILELIGYMYVYGFYMFFDFAGYSHMAVGAGMIFGIQLPENFNKPFVSKDLKEFWDRWHISLSHWFRDFIFTRIVMKMTEKKCPKKKLNRASLAFLINMSVMGIWHGTDLNYIVYGVYHGVLLAITEIYEKKSKFHKKNKKKKWYHAIQWFVTFNVVMFGFLIFSGKLI
ncbi:D-alanyl-lipoteichoic acid biosynthesis protein DltB [Lachnobacterium bovis]|jgi:membrane protein involved in D-alanine export|uniref:Teichoic acid D-alanyltransferase n=1 Tax=Lachnobacterium bovis DSM 14045 TaxID=1122142 RepID=A0A1H3GWV5_9FIRM|nr:D-alanyl-lipoteichoic acid biosynthesis protein DltB [Lachnobacterium bovis]MBQ1801523.1 D-alanyl-lipoteichoic acid biosynthesis protein DltB [Lachnobacterium sp.]SDY07796.1 membrane protein involved in D-alanine export [Lachnobacterium bovis DSM 14045]